MRLPRLVLCLALVLGPPGTLATQDVAATPQRDAIALALLQKSIAAMGGVVPKDSVAAGSVVIVAGSDTQKGTITISTLGTDQTLEQVQLPESAQTRIFSRGAARETANGTSAILSLETMVASQSLCFPLPFLFGALSNPDEAVQYIGAEDLNGQAAQHLRLSNTFASEPKRQYLAEFTVADLWLDATTGLPSKISVTLREGGGSSPRIPLNIYFSDYRNVGAVLYPFLVQKSLNGTPWTTITISSVSFNTGLADASFRVQ